jgi:hypothetical protein
MSRHCSSASHGIYHLIPGLLSQGHQVVVVEPESSQAVGSCPLLG